MRRVVSVATALAATALSAAALAGPAVAMGSGNPYEDMQVGVTYTVYEPAYTAGLKLQHFGGNTACATGVEENALGVYGKASARRFTITEGNPMCSDIGVGEAVLTRTIKGAKATVYAYCDPAATTACTAADVRRHGGHLAVTLPAATGLRPTTVWIETFGAQNLTAHQLVRIARGLAPVGQ
jgi:hypothetical protein